MEWYNKPAILESNEKIISVKTNAQTDFWRKTHYNFIRDNGHFYFRQVNGNFTAKVKLSGKFHDLYDQAGLMLRVDETTWIKCGIELNDGVEQVSSVVTRDFSDWSVVPIVQKYNFMIMRVTRIGPAVEIRYSFDGKTYNLLRLAYFTENPKLQVGIMCASPQGQGFEVNFEDFRIEHH